MVRVTQRASSLHEMCSHRLQRIHKGHKSKSASRTYNITVDHRRQILATTSGHSGSFNDKTTVLHYEFVTDIKSRAILDDYAMVEYVDEENMLYVVERGFKTVAETRKLNPKDSNTNVLSCIWESKNYKVWPKGEFQRFGDKSLNRISGGDGHKSLGK